MRKRYEMHSHSDVSNIIINDSIIKPKKLLDRAKELGLAGIALTDHEVLSNIPKLFDEIDNYPELKIVAGNEIYLCETREPNQPYYHFILNAKNKKGWRALRELSSEANLNSFSDRGMERRVTLYSDLERIVNKYPNSLIATTACLGGQVSHSISRMISLEECGKREEAKAIKQTVSNFLKFCIKLFGDDFYIECTPGCSEQQIKVNKRLKKMSEFYNIKMVIGTDAHYLTKEDRQTHKAYLNSQEKEREVDEFYEYSYLQSNEEIVEHLKQSDFSEDFIYEMFDNSIDICDKIEKYSIYHAQTIPKVEVADYPKVDALKKYPVLNEMYLSDDKIERYWVNQCVDKLDELNKTSDIYLKRLEEEATTKKIIGSKLGTNIFAYPVVLQHYINMFWECGSAVGAGRGSSCSGLNHYLLGVTQLDPIKWDLPWFRYLNEERTELPDIDVDLCPSKRNLILERIKAERGKNFIDNISDVSKKNLGCTLIATFGTEKPKSVILTACRGYRSEAYPNGIDVEVGRYLSNLVPVERGTPWSLYDVYYGNEEKERQAINLFIKCVDEYPGLFESMLSLEGLVSRKGIHASGVIMNDEDPYEFLAYMKAPSGDVITQFDLHDCEKMGATKYDFLVTEVQDKIVQCIELMQDDGLLDKNMSLKEIYDEYLSVDKIPLDDEKTWKTIQEASSLDLFQLDSDIGRRGAKKVKPSTMLELSAVNGLIRLMTAEKGAETPMDKYIRFKNNPQLWEKEMDEYYLTEKEKEAVRRYISHTYGIGISQEQLMRALMDKDICGFTLADANAARKTIAKKQINKIADLKAKVFSQATSENIAKYVWMAIVAPGIGYSFSDIHALAYSFIGLQTAYLPTKWNQIYWNTACLIVNSGSLENNSEETIVDIYAPEHQELQEGTTFEDLPDKSGKIKRTSSTNYAKMAKAIGNVMSKGIKISLVDINLSGYKFKPDVKHNTILFGLKGLNKVGGPVIEQIIAGRPYKSLKDFIDKTSLNKTAIISLIKSGAFDNVEGKPREEIMLDYISSIYGPKEKLTLSNFKGLIEQKLVPECLQFHKKVFLFNKDLKDKCKKGEYFILNKKYLDFYEKCGSMDEIEIIGGVAYISQKKWDKIYKSHMEDVKTWITKAETLKEYNSILFKKCWNDYASGTLSSWEMDSVCFYYHKHELSDVNLAKYGVVDFNSLPYEPVVDKYFKRQGVNIPLYKITKIAGTVIAKDDVRHTVSLLTMSGVVSVKFTKEYYAMYNKQNSIRQKDGTKKVADKSWFSRGSKIVVSGFRREDTFVSKKYKSTDWHQIYKIEEIKGKDMVLRHERYGGNV